MSDSTQGHQPTNQPMTYISLLSLPSIGGVITGILTAVLIISILAFILLGCVILLYAQDNVEGVNEPKTYISDGKRYKK